MQDTTFQETPQKVKQPKQWWLIIMTRPCQNTESSHQTIRHLVVLSQAFSKHGSNYMSVAVWAYTKYHYSKIMYSSHLGLTINKQHSKKASKKILMDGERGSYSGRLNVKVVQFFLPQNSTQQAIQLGTVSFWHPRVINITQFLSGCSSLAASND